MKMLSNKAGVPWLRCPYCGKRLFRLFDNTSCSNLPLSTEKPIYTNVLPLTTPFNGCGMPFHIYTLCKGKTPAPIGAGVLSVIDKLFECFAGNDVFPGNFFALQLADTEQPPHSARRQAQFLCNIVHCQKVFFAHSVKPLS